ncbi:hypothetical protein [Campylobacter concisus]|uniref:hypothetical protein n=1 Tax=Campylobacter concisus TaxID=199 RepID=UPI00122CD9DA|nr:hypothetical protein [Campylobacter concisus]
MLKYKKIIFLFTSFLFVGCFSNSSPQVNEQKVVYSYDRNLKAYAPEARGSRVRLDTEGVNKFIINKIGQNFEYKISVYTEDADHSDVIKATNKEERMQDRMEYLNSHGKIFSLKSNRYIKLSDEYISNLLCLAKTNINSSIYVNIEYTCPFYSKSGKKKFLIAKISLSDYARDKTIKTKEELYEYKITQAYSTLRQDIKVVADSLWIDEMDIERMKRDGLLHENAKYGAQYENAVEWFNPDFFECKNINKTNQICDDKLKFKLIQDELSK